MDISHKKRLGWSIVTVVAYGAIVMTTWGAAVWPGLFALPWFAYALHVLVGYKLFGLWYVARTPNEKPLHERLKDKSGDLAPFSIGSFMLMPVLWPLWVVLYTVFAGVPYFFELVSRMLEKVSEALSRTEVKKGRVPADRAALPSVSESAMSIDMLLERSVEVSKRYEAACKELEYRNAVLSAAAAGQTPSAVRAYEGEEDLWRLPLDELCIEQSRQLRQKRAIKAEIETRSIAASVVRDMRQKGDEDEAEARP